MKSAFLPVFACVLVAASALAQTASSSSTAASTSSDKASLATRTAGLQTHDGFFPYSGDEKKGEILIELTPAALATWAINTLANHVALSTIPTEGIENDSTGRVVSHNKG